MSNGAVRMITGVGGSEEVRPGPPRGDEYGVRSLRACPVEESPNQMSVQDKTGTSRRGQALTGAFAGVAVLAVLVAVYIGIQVSDGEDKPAAPAAASAPADPAAAAPTEPAPAPSDPAQPPAAQTPLDPALQQPPVVKAGKGKVTELKVTEIIAGKGPKLQAGQTIQANYVGVTYKDGKEF